MNPCLVRLKVAIFGAQPAASVMALSGPHVTIHADVPDIRSAYMAAPIFLAPMLVNTGLQNKLLEALALERVCIQHLGLVRWMLVHRTRS